MNTEAYQHLEMAKLLRRKALKAAHPEAMRRKANSFLVLAKMAAKRAARPRHARTHAISAGSAMNRFAQLSVNLPAPFPLHVRTTILDPRRLFGPMA
jgi:hypothetical protein